MKSYSIVLFVIGLLTAACKKDSPEAGLPAATQEGKNTFGCLVDGQVFLPNPGQAISITTREPLQASLYRTDVLVSARGNGGVDFALRNAFQPGVYPIGETQSARYGRYAYGSNEYYTNNTYSGTVTLTRIDTVARIAAGTFQFMALDYQSGKTTTITEGRFDVRLR